jgi:hypothetical protein
MDTFFSIIFAIFRGVWFLISAIALIISDVIGSLYDSHQARKIQQRLNQEAADKEGAATALAATYADDEALIQEIRKTVGTGYSLCIEPGKCAGCGADLKQTNLDPSTPYFCSDDCKERCVTSFETSILWTNMGQAEGDARNAHRTAVRDEEWRHKRALSDISRELDRRVAALRERLGYEPEMYLADSPDAIDTPRAARKDQKELTEMYNAEQALHRKNLEDIDVAHQHALIAIKKDAARKIRERIDFNRTNLNDLFADAKRTAENVKKWREEHAKREAADRQWYTPLGEPPPSA